MTTLEKIEDAVAKVMEYYVDNDEPDYRSGSGKRTTNIRLDWELAGDSSLEKNDIFAIMSEVIVNDLEDLVVNGDVNLHTDPLLMSFDGEQKRGKKVEEVEISHAHLQKEYKKGKESTEYTVWMTLYVRWPE